MRLQIDFFYWLIYNKIGLCQFCCLLSEIHKTEYWYGMTYHEDVAAVKDSFKKMLENGVYKADLFSDL